MCYIPPMISPDQTLKSRPFCCPVAVHRCHVQDDEDMHGWEEQHRPQRLHDFPRRMGSSRRILGWGRNCHGGHGGSWTKKWRKTTKTIRVGVESTKRGHINPLRTKLEEDKIWVWVNCEVPQTIWRVDSRNDNFIYAPTSFIFNGDASLMY